MIQRIQTVYLFVSLVFSLLLFYFPFYTAGLNDALVVGASGHLFLLPTAALIILMHIPVILSFNNRKRQAMFALVLMFLLALFVGLGVAAATTEDQDGLEIRGFRLGALLPLVSIVCVWLARVNILKDEALVRSMDRLR